MAHLFEPLAVGRTVRGRSMDGLRRFELDDFQKPAPAPISCEPVIAEPVEPRLLFDEDELARACAAVAARAAFVPEAASTARGREEEAMLREQLLAAVEGLRADLAARHASLRQTVGDLVALALDALLPTLREERLLSALEELVAEALGAGRPAPQNLIVEVPASGFELLAARLPALLAEAGIEAGYEIRPLAEGDLLRLTVEETWAELDAGALASTIRDRIRAVIEAALCAAPGRKGDDDAREG